MPHKPFIDSASWIWSEEATHAVPTAEGSSASHYQVRYFRRSFKIDNIEGRFLKLDLSADSRYVLYLNGLCVGRGPAKGDVNHHFYDSYELSSFLKVGENVVAVLVLDMSRVSHRPAFLGPPCSVMTYAGGLLVEGGIYDQFDNSILDLQSDANWSVCVDKAHRFQNLNTTFEGYLGYFEHRVSSLIPQGWNNVGFNDSKWPKATVLYKAELYENRRDPTSPYGLVPRIIPMLEEGEALHFADAYNQGGGVLNPELSKLLFEDKIFTLPAHQELEVVLDMKMLTTAYPHIQISSGQGSVFTLTYAEALRLPWGTEGALLMGKPQSLANLASHFADESVGWTFDRRGKVTGWCDIWEPSGNDEIFEPLHWRAFRYIGLKIKTGNSPLVIKAVKQRFTAYPLKIKATFETSQEALNRIWSIGLHTMRMCSHETFEDCPHYEQMQYAGDTMITSKLAMLTTGDTRLTKQALYQFDWSRISEGLTQARYPSRLLQVIPAWSIHWITMIKDYFLYSADEQTVRDMIPGILSVLAWYRSHTNSDGLPSKLPFWNITDWCPWWPRGVVPGSSEGATCIHSAQYINALDEAAWILVHCGKKTEADALRSEAATLRIKAHAAFWSEEQGLYFDRSGGPEVSQYGNAWAIVAGIAKEDQKKRMGSRFPNDEKLAPGSFFWWHTGFKALDLCGRYDEMPKYLTPWYEAISYGLSTFAEENSYWRSLCHAWAAHPVLEFQQKILGVTAVTPGFTHVALVPRICELTFAQGSVCTPLGDIHAQWKIEDKEFVYQVMLPVGILAEAVLPDGSKHVLKEGKTVMKCQIP